MITSGCSFISAILRRRLACVVVAGALVFVAMSVHATSVAKLTDPDLVRLSSVVAEGRVLEVRSGWTPDRTRIFTTVTIQITNQIKGARPQNGRLVVNMLGGRVGDVVMEIIGQPTFTTGENVIVFLDATRPQYTPITGLFQGKLTVEQDPGTGALNVIDRGVSRDEFVRNISRIVTEQERGR